MLQLCRHILLAGNACEQPALKGGLYCRFHNNLRPMLPSKSESPQPIPFAFPEDRAALQLDLFLVLKALAAGEINAKTANAMTYILNSSMRNLDKMAQSEEKPAVTRIILTPEGEEVALPRQKLEEGEAQPYHYKDCPCPSCAEKYRSQPPEQHHPQCQCGLCEPAEATSVSSTSPDAQSSSSRPKRQRRATEGTVPSPRTAKAENLYSQNLTKDPNNQPLNENDYLYGDEIRKHEAQYAARVAAAIREGIEPPKYEPYDPEKAQREEEQRQQEEIERNKAIGERIWQERFASKENDPQPTQWPQAG